MGPLINTLAAALAAGASFLPAAAAPSSERISLREEGAGEITLVATGDIRLDGPHGALIKLLGPGAPTRRVRPWLSGDIVFGNLETAVTRRGEKAGKKWNFRCPEESLAALTQAGYTVLNLANNHVMDYGPTGLKDTLEALAKRGFVHMGAGKDLAAARKPVFVSAGGLRVGFLGLTSTVPEFMWAKTRRPGTAYSDFDRFPRWIGDARKECDFLVVSFHGGTEKMEVPQPIQRAFGRAAVDAGADLGLGHHPHVLQAVEYYKGKPILHSLGNFLFVSPFPATRWSAIARIRLGREGVRHIEFVPVITWPPLRPAGAKGTQAVLKALDGDGALSSHPGLFSVVNPEAED